MSPSPIYTAENCRFAFQLLWTYSLFWQAAPGTDSWFAPLTKGLEADGIRLLNHRFVRADQSQFLVSTLPNVAPDTIAQRIKGRLQYLVRSNCPRAFQRNYSLRSLGSTKREKLESYVAGQLQHHPTDDHTRWRLDDLRVIRPDVDLSQPRYTAHAQFWFNLHVVLEGERSFTVGQTGAFRQMLVNAATAKGHLLSRAAFLPDHLHWLMGCGIDDSPSEVALAYMNNLAFAVGMQSVFRPNCFVGTFGEYDVGAIRGGVIEGDVSDGSAESPRATGASPVGGGGR